MNNLSYSTLLELYNSLMWQLPPLDIYVLNHNDYRQIESIERLWNDYERAYTYGKGSVDIYRGQLEFYLFDVARHFDIELRDDHDDLELVLMG